MRYLPREEAPFGERLWEQLEATVVGAARSQLAGRRLLDLVGPLGFGVRAVGKLERAVEGEVTFRDARATMTSAAVLPIPMLQSEFVLSIRDVAAAEETGNPIDLARVALAAIATARLEDDLIFNGSPALGIDGLLTGGATQAGLGDWADVAQPVNDLIAATSALDAAGFPGPYAAALAPGLYNALLRLYQNSDTTLLEHARQVITAGIVKTPALQEGGVVLATGKQFVHLLLAQDMTAAFVGPQGTDYEFVIVESLVPRISVPEAICVLGGRRKGK